MIVEYKNSKALEFLQDVYIPKKIQYIDFFYENEKIKLIEQLGSESIFKLYSMIFDMYSNDSINNAYESLYEFFYQMICDESHERADLITSILIQRVDPIFHIYEPSRSQTLRTYSE
jgi:hypothetical protein